MSMLPTRQDAEDLVQDMYIRIYDKSLTFEQIKYDDNDINKYYIYLMIRNMALDKIKKRGIDISDVDYDHPCHSEYVDEHKILDDIQREIDTWDYYERTLFEVYLYSGLSLRDIAYGSDKTPRLISKDKEIHTSSIKSGTGISVSSIFHTIKKCKERLKDKFDGR